MVFENLTLFELHLENSRFGPSFGGDDEEEAEAAEEAYDAEETGDEGGRGGGMRRALGVLLLFVVVGLAVRRYRSGGESMEDVVEEESEQITIEHAAE